MLQTESKGTRSGPSGKSISPLAQSSAFPLLTWFEGRTASAPKRRSSTTTSPPAIVRTSSVLFLWKISRSNLPDSVTSFAHRWLLVWLFWLIFVFGKTLRQMVKFKMYLELKKLQSQNPTRGLNLSSTQDIIRMTWGKSVPAGSYLPLLLPKTNCIAHSGMLCCKYTLSSLPQGNLPILLTIFFSAKSHIN